MNYPAVAMAAFGLTSLAVANPCSEGAAIARTFGNAQTQFAEPGQAAAPNSSTAATREEQIANPGKGIVHERVWFYRGVVEDPSGTEFAASESMLSGVGREARLGWLPRQSDSHAILWFTVTNGEYTAVMQAKGFSPLIYIFELHMREWRSNFDFA